MLSGNGRHRRPRQAPALLVAAGVTGSAIAIPLLGASGASAADGTVWDKVAECETGGSWSANEGDGEYGGLALSQEDWEAYGGLDYASRPDLASRNQQIAVAQKLLADQGVGAWGTCGLTSGLSKESGGGTVDTGVPDDSSDSPVSSGLSDLSKGLSGSSNTSEGAAGTSTEPSAESSTDSSTGSGNSANTPPSSPSSPSPSSPSSGTDGPTSSKPSDGSDASGSQASDGSPSATPGTDDSDKSGQSAGSWTLVDTGSLDADPLGSGRHRGASAEEGTAGGASTASSGRHAANTLGGTAGTYTVRSGDSLVSIADSLDLDGGWRALYAENRDLIGADPSAIVPGQTLDTGIE